eukprot:CAMPEP_0198234728 /NCGR_PEP_ID=MMETSP1446-20131203/666_1 /TAXON_ID=1461542 ORGANISM="Unidentified sp, Strain CCMP2111" /NCGR_SAMPLE_ID=MMETSP1446 /ASSEMBLY_ACC=CAM_ASM_001112 /LENGTH=138 /DNA_ID=CAMNT_0043915549 /DNA_START=61 /DNA_END=478 /DNA_ORIENTATION=+
MDCNVFQFCKCLKLLGNVMILIVLGLVGLSYYPVIISVYGPELISASSSATKAVAFIVVLLFHVVAFLMLWSYFACILTDPGRVPEDFQPSGDLDGELQSANGMPEDKSDPEDHASAGNVRNGNRKGLTIVPSAGDAC